MREGTFFISDVTVDDDDVFYGGALFVTWAI